MALSIKNLINAIVLIILISYPSLAPANGSRIFNKNYKAVVTIYGYDKDGDELSQGSGFFIKNDGTFVSNHHVIDSARTIEIKIGEKKIKAKPIYSNRRLDVAILKITDNLKNTTSVKLGDPSRINIGDKVYVIGTPLGMEHTLSEGIVSAIRRFGDGKQKYIQFTAPISPGSSGGPVFNKDGEVIGIATMTVCGMGLSQSQNLNLAIPINIIKHNSISRAQFKKKDKFIVLRLFNHKGMVCLFIGVIIFIIFDRLNLFRRWFNFLFTLQHELIHLGMAGLFGGHPISLTVTQQGGAAASTKSNFMVRLSPYVFPIFCFLFLGISFLLSPQYKPMAFVCGGIFYGQFLIKTFQALLQLQPDIQKGLWKGGSYLFIFLANIAILTLIGAVSKIA